MTVVTDADERATDSPHPAPVSAATYRRRRLVVALGALLAIAVVVLAIWGVGQWLASPPKATVIPPIATTDAPATIEAAPVPTPEEPIYDTTDPNSLTVLVNKHYSLQPQDYAPADLVAVEDLGIPSLNGHSLRQPAAEAFRPMYQAALSVGISLDMTSGYRDFQLQTELYNRYLGEMGQEATDATSARPGFSEHQTGLAADISAAGEGCILEGCFADTTAGQWLAENAWQFGWILRYPNGQTPTTGYEFEPWHYRFVGIEAAVAYHASGAVTFEDFLGSEPVPGYEN